jgi:hypothetical protein
MELEDIKIEDIKILDSTPPNGCKVTSSMAVEATVDVSPQPMRTILPYIKSVQNIPSTLSAEAQIVLQALLSCFEKQRNVSEGLIGDVMFGFDACNIPPLCTYAGLKDLHKEGYIKFQAKDNTYIDLESDKAGSAFIRYQPKLLELVYESQ